MCVCVCVFVWRGLGNLIYGIVGCACRMVSFFSAAKYMISSFFQQKVFNRSHFLALLIIILYLDNYH